MPELSGISATRRIRKIEKEQKLPPVPIIAVTANIFENDQNACFEAGMNGFLAKPVSLKKFREALFEFLPKSLRKQKTLALLPAGVSETPGRSPDHTIDLQAGITHSGGEEIYKTMINIFIEDTPEVIRNIKHSADLNSLDDATRFCHNLQKHGRNYRSRKSSDRSAIPVNTARILPN